MRMNQILVIEDEELILSTVRKVLAGQGYEVHTARGGAEGLKICKTEAIDLALIDLWMPAMSGLEVITKLRSPHPDMKVILMTGEVRADSLCSEIPILQKPFSLNELIETVESALSPETGLP